MALPAIEKRRDKKINLQKTVEGSAGAVFFDMNWYESFIKKMKSTSHIREPREIISNRDTDYVRTFKIKSKNTGKIMEIYCPELTALSIFGKNQAAILSENEPKEIEIRNPYFFCVRCYDGHNRELGPATRMNFKKIINQGGISRAWRACYGDLSPGYVFPSGVFLCGDEVLALEVIDPDIDIEKVELSMEVNIINA